MRRLRLFGHPLHPATVHFPIGLLAGATVVDVLVALGLEVGPEVASLLLILGLCAAAASVATGFLDFLAIAKDPSVERTAVLHLLCISVALGLYAASLWFRHDTESAALVLATSLGGAFVLLFAGWLGGQLVYRYRQGVESSEIGHVGRKTQ